MSFFVTLLFSQALVFLMLLLIPFTRGVMLGFLGTLLLSHVWVSLLFYFLIKHLYLRYKNFSPHPESTVKQVGNGIFMTLLFIVAVVVTNSLARTLLLHPISSVTVEIGRSVNPDVSVIGLNNKVIMESEQSGNPEVPVIYLESHEWISSCSSSNALETTQDFTEDIARIVIRGCAINTSIDSGRPETSIPIPNLWLTESSEKTIRVILNGENNDFFVSLKNKNVTLRPGKLENAQIGKRTTTILSPQNEIMLWLNPAAVNEEQQIEILRKFAKDNGYQEIEYRDSVARNSPFNIKLRVYIPKEKILNFDGLGRSPSAPNGRLNLGIVPLTGTTTAYIVASYEYL